MRTDSNEFIYAVATIVIIHFVIGFIWLWRKMNKKKKLFKDF
jgi:flagellar biogenesis protein FliO